MKPDPGDTVGPFRATPTTPYVTLLAEAKAASDTVRLVAPLLRCEPVWTIAAEPLVPPVSTPSHCDTIHIAFSGVLEKTIPIVPEPGLALIARKIMSRMSGELVVAKSTLDTSVHVDMPPPVTVGVLTPDARSINTASVMSALAAGATDAVV